MPNSMNFNSSRRALKRLTIAFLTVAFLLGNSGIAYALDVDVGLGDVTVSAGEATDLSVSHTTSDGAVTSVISCDEIINIYQSTNTTTNNIVVESGVQDVQIALNDVNIDTTGSSNLAAFEIQDGAQATVELNGNNYLSGNASSGGAAIQTDGIGNPGNYASADGGTVIITDTDDDGTLTVVGGKNSAGIGSAGITGGSGNIGVGVYELGNQENYGTVIINGGTITATGGSTGNAAAIGGGNHRDGGSITITGDAEVTTNGTIGAGLYSSKDKFIDEEGNFVQINSGSITISGDAVVTAIGNYDSAGIGGMMYSSGGEFTITDNAVVYAEGQGRAAGIGGGYQGNGGTVVISGNAVVTAQGGTKDDGLAGGAGIGGGTQGLIPKFTDGNGKTGGGYLRGGNGGSITIAGSATVTATGGAGAAGIGSGSQLEAAKQNSAAGYGCTWGEFTGAITIEDGTTVLAFSDGTRWAIDIEGYDVDGVQTSILQGRFISDIWKGVSTGTDGRFNIGYTDRDNGGMALLVAKDTASGQIIYLPVNVSNNEKTSKIHALSYALTVGEDGNYYVQVSDGRYTIIGVESFTEYDNLGNLAAGTGPYAPFNVDTLAGLVHNSNDFQHLSGNVPPIPDPDPDPDPDPPPLPQPDPAPVPVNVIEEPEVPLGVIEMEDEETPLANARSWALYNFALMELTIFESIALLFTYLRKERSRDEDDRQRKMFALRVFSVFVALGSIVAFVLTENIYCPLVLTDGWTPLMAVLALAQSVITALSKKRFKADGNDSPDSLHESGTLGALV